MVEYSDTHTVEVPEGWNATDFAGQVLGNVPAWLTKMLKVRDRIVRTLGFATQPGGSAPTPDLTVGGSAGPFVFTEVSPEVVRGGNSDRRMVLDSSFSIEHRNGQSYGVMATATHSNDVIGAIYLTAIWPAHKLMMHRVLRAGMAGART